MLSIKWENVDFEKNEVTVYGRKTKTFRTIPIRESFKQRLLSKQEKAKSDFVIEYHGKPMQKFRRSLQTAVEKAEITNPVRMYDVRHLFATVQLAGGADLAAVSKLVGHASTHETANTYYELLKGEKEKAVGLLPDIFDEEERDPDLEQPLPKNVARFQSRGKNVIQ